jgi:adenylate cyclase
MPKEIERKFLVQSNAGDVIKSNAKLEKTYIQGYLTVTGKTEVRVSHDSKIGEMTVKSIADLERDEFKMVIGLTEAKDLLNACVGSVFKSRYVWLGWEIDIYHADLKGLIVAEFETLSVNDACVIPPWLESFVIREVTYESNFKNRNLAQNATLPQ